MFASIREFFGTRINNRSFWESRGNHGSVLKPVIAIYRNRNDRGPPRRNSKLIFVRTRLVGLFMEISFFTMPSFYLSGFQIPIFHLWANLNQSLRVRCRAAIDVVDAEVVPSCVLERILPQLRTRFLLLLTYLRT